VIGVNLVAFGSDIIEAPFKNEPRPTVADTLYMLEFTVGAGAAKLGRKLRVILSPVSECPGRDTGEAGTAFDGHALACAGKNIIPVVGELRWAAGFGLFDGLRVCMAAPIRT
jgi:hypothetical protein